MACRVNTKRIPRYQQSCVVKARRLLAIITNCIGNSENSGKDLLTNNSHCFLVQRLHYNDAQQGRGQRPEEAYTDFFCYVAGDGRSNRSQT